MVIQSRHVALVGRGGGQGEGLGPATFSHTRHFSVEHIRKSRVKQKVEEYYVPVPLPPRFRIFMISGFENSPLLFLAFAVKLFWMRLALAPPPTLKNDEHYVAEKYFYLFFFFQNVFDDKMLLSQYTGDNLISKEKFLTSGACVHDV